VILIYNTLLTVLGLLMLPLILPVIPGRAKYRGRTLERLGLKTGWIRERLRPLGDGPVIWIHALSVGEVTSAVPLVKALRRDIGSAVIVFTAATSSGKKIAEPLIGPHVDLVLSGPLDLRFAVRQYIEAIRPNLFILVETDFWPNWLHQLNRRNIPAMLVNGRISRKSFAAYHRFSFFFKPLFRCFALLSMQTEEDRNKMIELGLPADRVITLGNLKYDMADSAEKLPIFNHLTPDHAALTQENEKIIWVCGSTHPGEEEVLFSAFSTLISNKIVRNKNIQEQFFLILAPRDISRGDELVQLARRFDLEARTRSGKAVNGNVLILDTFGELAACYSRAKLAFVGGSLVRRGGHNPIEPAVHGVPVLFGPHMEDFAEIAQELVACDGARIVDGESLTEAVSALLIDNETRSTMGTAAKKLVERHRGGVHRHIQAIEGLLRLR
jgi:3-deoxy-D-manno-octulosonic-acid transferase